MKCEKMVPKAGFEPAHPGGRQTLNLVRLPFRHFGTRGDYGLLSKSGQGIGQFINCRNGNTYVVGEVVPRSLFPRLRAVALLRASVKARSGNPSLSAIFMDTRHRRHDT